MAKRKTQTADAPREPTPEQLAQALAELELDRPYYTCRVVGGRLEFALYGGDVAVWPTPRRKSRTKED